MTDFHWFTIIHQCQIQSISKKFQVQKYRTQNLLALSSVYSKWTKGKIMSFPWMTFILSCHVLCSWAWKKWFCKLWKLNKNTSTRKITWILVILWKFILLCVVASGQEKFFFFHRLNWKLSYLRNNNSEI